VLKRTSSRRTSVVSRSRSFAAMQGVRVVPRVLIRRIRCLMATADPGEDLALALELADVADAITLARYRAADLVVETKPDLTPVSEADKAVERALRDRIGAVRPGDAILGEEYGISEGSGGDRRWIVDPIDGTKNYVRGIPVWATLLALQDGDRVT